jgi:hypothetical protein
MKNGLERLWQAWKRFGQFMGDIVGRVVLTLFYFTIFMPFGLGVRLLGDRLDMKGWMSPTWTKRETRDLDMKDVRRQA